MAKFKNQNLFLKTNTETITSTKNLTYTDPQVQNLNPSTASRDVVLPLISTIEAGLLLFITNTGSTYNLVVKEAAGDGGSTIVTIPPGKSTNFISGSEWKMNWEGAAAGSNTQIQFNSSGSFGASSNLTFNSGTNTLSSNNISATTLSGTTISGTTITQGGYTVLDTDDRTSTPTASKIPLADGSGKIANGWLNTGTGNGLDADSVDGKNVNDSGTGTSFLWTAGKIASELSSVAGGSPGGADTYIQYNDSGSFGGSSNLTWDGSTSLIIGGSVLRYNSTGTISASTGSLSIGRISVAGSGYISSGSTSLICAEGGGDAKIITSGVSSFILGNAGQGCDIYGVGDSSMTIADLRTSLGGTITNSGMASIILGSGTTNSSFSIGALSSGCFLGGTAAAGTMGIGGSSKGCLAFGSKGSSGDFLIYGGSKGSAIFGYAGGGESIYANGENVFQFGVGSNSTSDSLQVGGNIKILGSATSTSANGQITKDGSGNVLIHSGGSSVNVSSLGGDAWSDPVDSSIVPASDTVYDLGTKANHFGAIYSDKGLFTNNNLGTQTVGDGGLLVGSTFSGSTITSSGAGSFTSGGFGGGSVTDTISSTLSSWSGGYCYWGFIKAQSRGSFAFGSSGSYSGSGSISTGSGISSGSMAFGNATSGGSIFATGKGSLAFGSAVSLGSIISSGEGSMAFGSSSGDGATITASASNSFQFGLGTNSTSNSLQVGGNIKILGSATSTSANGEISQDASGNILVYSGGEESKLTKVDYRSVCIVPFEASTDVSIGNGEVAFAVPVHMNDMELVDALAAVDTQGTANTTNIQIRRVRGATETDMLSTLITIESEYYARDGVISATEATRTINTGDRIYIDVDAVHTTPPKGLSVTLTFKL